MFLRETYYKIVVIICLITWAYSHMVQIRIEGHLKAMGAISKPEVNALLGEPLAVFACGSGLPSTHYEDQFCQANVQEVWSFKRCPVTFLCTGWNYVMFGKDDKVYSTYMYAAPFFNSTSR